MKNIISYNRSVGVFFKSRLILAHSEPRQSEGIIKNISPGGACVIGDPPNLLETFQIEIHPSEGDRIAVAGQVARKDFKTKTAANSQGIGVRFINPNSDMRELIERMNRY